MFDHRNGPVDTQVTSNRVNQLGAIYLHDFLESVQLIQNRPPLRTNFYRMIFESKYSEIVSYEVIIMCGPSMLSQRKLSGSSHLQYKTLLGASWGSSWVVFLGASKGLLGGFLGASWGLLGGLVIGSSLHYSLLHNLKFQLL